METSSIHTLPDEVLGKIFSHLSQSDILRFLLPVCRRWQAVAQSEVLSRGLTFCCYNNHYQPLRNDYHHHHDDAVTTEEALCLIQAIPHLMSLKLQGQPDTVQLLQAAGSCCTKLRQLVIEDCSNNYSALTAALSSVFRSCDQLTGLSLISIDIADSLPFWQELCTALPKLRRLTIIDCEWFGSAELDAVIDSCPHMQQFRTNSTCSDAQLSRLVQRWGSSLQMLDLWASGLSDAGLAELAGCSQLRSLQLRWWTSSGDGLQQLASLAQLEQFGLLWCFRVRAHNILDFFSQSRSASRLRNIELPTCPGVHDGVLTPLAAACPRVESVDVADCEHITAAGVRELLRSCRRLLRLNVSGTDPSVEQILRELPQLAPQLRRLKIDCASQRPFPELVGSVEAQMPGLKFD